MSVALVPSSRKQPLTRPASRGRFCRILEVWGRCARSSVFENSVPSARLRVATASGRRAVCAHSAETERPTLRVAQSSPLCQLSRAGKSLTARSTSSFTSARFSRTGMKPGECRESARSKPIVRGYKYYSINELTFFKLVIIDTNQTQFTRGAPSSWDSAACLAGGERPVARQVRETELVVPKKVANQSQIT
jgi:hypothetical protein